MATERIAMHQLKEILRQKLKQKRSHRDVADAIGVSIGLVSKIVKQAVALEFAVEDIDKLDELTLENMFYGTHNKRVSARPEPDPTEIHVELRRTGVTLQLLHMEYLEKFPNGYQYSKFCTIYREWLAKRAPIMRQTHVAGDKIFVDYSGKKPHIVDPTTGEIRDVELFVAVLGASNYTFAEASYSQKVPDFIASTMHAFTFFGGVSRAVVPDQLKSAVVVANRYDPGIQRTFDDLGRHYGTTILPARPGSPRDKAKVEVAVQIAQRWILAKIRNHVFHSLGELNARIRELLEDLNARTMRHYKASRKELFERLDKPALRPLPADVFEHAAWKKAKLNVDYHIVYDQHYYSAPHSLIHEEIWVRATTTTIELFHRGSRVASHPRSYVPFRHTTIASHMPMAHQKHAEWTPSRIQGWASTIGPMTEELTRAILAERKHPEHGYRSCLGLFRLAKLFGQERLESACARALSVSARSYRHVESILKNGLDRTPMTDNASRPNIGIIHENVRGREYYH